MRIQKSFHIAVAVIAVTTTLMAQFGQVSTTFDMRLLRESERQVIAPLKDEITQFFKITSWDNDYSDLEIPLHIQLIFEGTAAKGAETTYLAQLLISNGSDQRYFDTAIQFTYNSGTPLVYSPGYFEPLPGLLTFYGYLILAGEADTYDYQAGTEFYEICREIALRGSTSKYSKGWSARLTDANNLSSNSGLRKVRLSFYFARDLFDNGDMDRALGEFKKMIDGLDQVYREYGREHYTGLFIKAHAAEIARMLGALGQTGFLNDMIELDTDNDQIYQEALDRL